MRNQQVGDQQAAELESIVARLLNDLGNPEPPLDLAMVREALRLDLQYYTLLDPSMLNRMVHKLRVAGKQVVRRPSLLLDVVRKVSLKALLLPDEKRILIDGDAPVLKHRWMEAHEIGHSLAPWHSRFLHGDHDESLRLSCHEELEQEANHVAGQLLFLLDRFAAEARDRPRTLASVMQLGKKFGNTKTSTLWRFVERAHNGAAMVGLVSPNPWRVPESFDPRAPCRYRIESPAFRGMFGDVSDVELFDHLRSYCRSARGGPLGTGEVVLRDDNGAAHVFQFESFSNSYEVLTLAIYERPCVPSVTMP